MGAAMTQHQKSSVSKGAVWVSVLGSTVICFGVGFGWDLWNHGPSPEEIAAGKTIFEHVFTVNDPRCGGGDGLGPVFNERSCVACHFQAGVGGAGSNKQNVTSFEVFPVPGRHEIVSGGVHALATKESLLESVALLKNSYPPIPVAVRTVDGCDGTQSVHQADFDPLQINEINTPPLFGIGLIEKISDAAIGLLSARRSISRVFRELGGDFSGTGVGRLRTIGRGRLGKFGWKSQFATVEEFVANACAIEIGLTNPRVSQPVPRRALEDSDAKLDMTKQELYELVAFVRNIPRPQQILPAASDLREAVVWGEKLFSTIGCADCHVPNIGGVEGVYSDFHLYEVENDELADEYVEPDFNPEFTLPFEHPRPAEWKTPPLWGVADSAPYFHDGKSPTLAAAIKRHGRDGRYARDNFKKLSQADKFAIVSFLKSLRAPLLGRVDIHPRFSSNAAKAKKPLKLESVSSYRVATLR